MEGQFEEESWSLPICHQKYYALAKMERPTTFAVKGNSSFANNFWEELKADSKFLNQFI